VTPARVRTEQTTLRATALLVCLAAISMLPSHRLTAASHADGRAASAALGAAGRSDDRPAEEPTPRTRTRYGLASYYARDFDGRLAASGRPFDNDAMMAAHPSLPFGTVARVMNLENGRPVDVRIVDRGPARGPREDGVIIDLSRAAAARLGFQRAGRVRVRVDVLPGPA